MEKDIEQTCDRIAHRHKVDPARLKQVVRNHGISNNGPEAIITLLASMLRDSTMRCRVERLLGELRDEVVKKFSEYQTL